MRFASEADFDVSEALHRQYGTTYYHATRLFAPPMRRHVHAVYGFVRVPDEMVDNPAGSLDVAQRQLDVWTQQFEQALAGRCPDHPAMRAFVDTMHECDIPDDEPRLFLEAMKMDLTVRRYATYRDLEGYMRGSAAAVGTMMSCVMGVKREAHMIQAAQSLGNAMQLTNFLRDVGEDADRGRIYLPLDELDAFSVREYDILNRRMTPEFAELMRFQVARSRALYCEAHVGLRELQGAPLRAVVLARDLYARILDRIEAQSYDVYRQRARTSRGEKLASTVRVLASPQAVLRTWDRQIQGSGSSIP